MINLIIDNQPVQVVEGRTILEASRELGVPIPTLCYHPALKPYGACRLCMVEISQPPRPPRLVASCTYPCEEGLQVLTNSLRVQKSRRMTAELLLASAWTSPEILKIADQLGVHRVRYRLPDEDLCILCGLCVRACQEIVGINAISFIHRGIDKQVSPPFQVFSSACIACGTCTLICPTGAIQLKEVAGAGAEPEVHGASTAENSNYCQLCGDIDLRPQFFIETAGHPDFRTLQTLARGE